jgi:hypothetical protein
MRWRTQPDHKLIPVEDVLRLTGLDPVELLGLPDVQRLERIDQAGGREELVRVPIRLLIQTQDEEPRD